MKPARFRGIVVAPGTAALSLAVAIAGASGSVGPSVATLYRGEAQGAGGTGCIRTGARGAGAEDRHFRSMNARIRGCRARRPGTSPTPGGR